MTTRSPSTSTDNGGSRIVDAAPVQGDRDLDRALRPTRFDDFVGQRKIKDNLHVYVQAARQRGEPLDHVLFCGPPGLGKTTLAHILGAGAGRARMTRARARPSSTRASSPRCSPSSSGATCCSSTRSTACRPVIEENLYTAIEDFRIDIVHGDGPYAADAAAAARAVHAGRRDHAHRPAHRPMLSRFGIVERLDYYPAEELREIVLRSARLLEHRDRRTMPRSRSRGARAARRASPTACCGARATSPRCSATARIDRAARPRRSTASRSTTPASTRWIGAPARHHRALQGRPGRRRHAGGRAQRAARHARGRVRALSAAAGLSGAHRARPRGDRRAYEHLGLPLAVRDQQRLF